MVNVCVTVERFGLFIPGLGLNLDRASLGRMVLEQEQQKVRHSSAAQHMALHSQAEDL